jgi:hypothetical protein
MHVIDVAQAEAQVAAPGGLTAFHPALSRAKN